MTPRARAGRVPDPRHQDTEAALPRPAGFRLFAGGLGAPVGIMEKDVKDGEDSHNFSSSQGLSVPAGHTQLSPGPQVPQHLLQPSRAHNTPHSPRPPPHTCVSDQLFPPIPQLPDGLKNALI